MILLPSIFMFTNIEDRYKNDENRKLSSFDISSVRDLKKFIIDFKNYYTDNFGTRFLLYNLYKNNISDRFKESPSNDKIIYGKEDWLFLGNYPDMAFSEAKGSRIFNKNELELISKNVNEVKRFCEQNKIKLCITIVPGKHTVYKEFLPYKFPKQKTKLDQLLELEPNLIDLRNSLNKAKKDEFLYKKKDTHWNQLGAFVGYKEIMKFLMIDNHIIKILDSSDIDHIEYKDHLGDLNEILGNKKIDKIPTVVLKNKKAQRIISKLDVPYYHRLSHDTYEMRYQNKEALNSEKIMFLRDSFSSDLIPFFSVSFQESLFIYNHYFEKELIKKEKPNILVYEITERFIDNLLKIDQK